MCLKTCGRTADLDQEFLARLTEHFRQTHARESGDSTDVCNYFFVVFLDVGAMNLAGAFGADFIGDHAVALGVDFGAEFLPKRFERVCFKAAFEHGVLDTHAPVFADFGDFVEAFGIGDIVGDEGEIGRAHV